MKRKNDNSKIDKIRNNIKRKQYSDTAKDMTIIMMYSLRCYFPNLEHIAYCPLVNWQSSVTPEFLTVRHTNRCSAYCHRVWEGGNERPRLSTTGYSHCFGLAVVEFKSVHCHPGFDVINTILHGEMGIWDLDRGFPELRVIGVWVAKDRVLLNVRGKRRCVKTTESKLVEHRMRWELAQRCGSGCWQTGCSF